MFELLTLSVVWLAWCALHSFLISRFILEFCESRFCRFHRLIFNFIAATTFLAASIYSHSLPKTIVYEFTGISNFIRILILIACTLLFIVGALGYDMFYFAGFSQISSNNHYRVLTNSGEFKQDGLLQITRHPWYFLAIFLVWSNSAILYNLDLVSKTILTIYLFAGTLLEERKLIWQFGDQYRQYQKEVSMLFPFKWLLNLTKKRTT